MSDPKIIPDVLMQQSLIYGIDIGIMTCDQEDNIEWVNPYFCNLLSVTYDDIKGSPVATLMDIDPLREDSSFRIRVKTHDDKELWLACVQSQNKEANGKIVRYFVDISDLQRRQPLRHMISAGYDASRLDPNTGTLNRRAIIQELNNQISRTRRYGNPLSAILLQLPRSADMQNDEQKEFLHAIAGSINANLRWVDVIGSLSAGNFLIILPESNGSAAALAWEKIDNDIRTLTQEKGLNKNDYQVNYSDWKQDNSADEMIQRLEASLNQKVA
jgi:GGDEF domain-containing protein